MDDPGPVEATAPDAERAGDPADYYPPRLPPGHADDRDDAAGPRAISRRGTVRPAAASLGRGNRSSSSENDDGHGSAALQDGGRRAQGAVDVPADLQPGARGDGAGGKAPEGQP